VNDSLDGSERQAPRALERLVERASRAGASDIHLQMLGDSAQISFRLDGVMTPIDTLNNPLAERMVGRIKYLARLKTYQDSLPQDGRIGKAELGCASDIRVATYPTVTGEKIVLRLFTGAPAKTLRDLQLPSAACDDLEAFLRRNCGLLLLTGPAGSGKTTTIYACLRYLAETGGRHIITVEDPVEQIVPGVMQTEICEARGLSFATASRHLLRQDPQVLVIGEIRDEETATIAVRAALTGHLVIATLHGGSCRTVLERLLVLCPDKYAALSSTELVFNQRLLRRVCKDCAGQGCENCLGTGYQGRVPIVEWLRLDERIRREARENGSETIKVCPSLQDCAQTLVRDGITDSKEYQNMFSS